MTPLLLGLLSVVLEGDVVVPQSHWRAIDVRVAHAGTLVKASFRAPADGSRVQAYIVTRANAERFAQGGALRPLAMSSPARESTFYFVAERAGDYILLLDNRMEGRRATPVHVRVESLPPASTVRTVPPERRRVVELASVLFFLAVVAYSARQLMK
ncbi:MAG TPA: hypothetical protein VFL57_20615 [Bryobacteraceae bacterium]|nr:hypothetical protein [Bryobacteraceae bacterium]